MNTENKKQVWVGTWDLDDLAGKPTELIFQHKHTGLGFDFGKIYRTKENNPGEVHTHDAQAEVIFTLTGKAELWIEPDQLIQLVPGVGVAVPSGLRHQLRVDNEEGVTLFTMLTPVE